MPDCEFCGRKVLRNTWNKKYRHINICQKPTERFFCSLKCKLAWIFKSREDSVN